MTFSFNKSDGENTLHMTVYFFFEKASSVKLKDVYLTRETLPMDSKVKQFYNGTEGVEVFQYKIESINCND